MHISRKIAVPIVGLVMGTGGFAFLASNSFAAAPGAGSGTVAASGYTVANIHNVQCGSGSATPEDICYTNFTLQVQNPSAPDAANAYVKFDNSGWYDCTAGSYAGTRVRSFMCDLRTAPVSTSYSNMTVSAVG